MTLPTLLCGVQGLLVGKVAASWFAGASFRRCAVVFGSARAQCSTTMACGGAAALFQRRAAAASKLPAHVLRPAHSLSSTGSVVGCDVFAECNVAWQPTVAVAV